MNLQEFFLKQKEAIRRRSNEVFALVRPECLSWKPEKDALSVGEMLRHIWVSEEGVRRVALDGNFAYYETRIPRGLRATLGTDAGLDEELRNLDRVREARPKEPAIGVGCLVEILVQIVGTAPGSAAPSWQTRSAMHARRSAQDFARAGSKRTANRLLR